MTPDGLGSDGFSPFSILQASIQRLEARLTEHNQAIRADMNAGFRELGNKFERHEDQDEAVKTRVTIIETERGIEKSTATRHGAIAGSIASGLILTLVAAAKKAFGW